MSKLPDFEALAIFAKVAQTRSFAAAASELNLSKATVSKAVSRLETRLRVRLFNRTSRRIALTESGRELSTRAAHILAEGELAEADTLMQAAAPSGLVRLAAPMSFGISHIAPLLPEFLALYLDISMDFHLTDAMVDLITGGFDAAVRIASLPDSSLVARTLAPMPRYLVGAPSYLANHGRPQHPNDLAGHRCVQYAYLLTPGTWRFTDKEGVSAQVHPSGPLRVNNGEAMLPALIAGIGLGVLPEFIVGAALADGRLEKLLPDWSLTAGAIHWITPPGGLRPRRVEVLGDFLARKLTPNGTVVGAARPRKAQGGAANGRLTSVRMREI
jgi:DNA-binding transcriptional LysR family regulator